MAEPTSMAIALTILVVVVAAGTILWNQDHPRIREEIRFQSRFVPIYIGAVWLISCLMR